MLLTLLARLLWYHTRNLADRSNSSVTITLSCVATIGLLPVHSSILFKRKAMCDLAVCPA